MDIAFRQQPDDTPHEAWSDVLQMPLGQFVFQRLIFFGVLPPLGILNATLRDGHAISDDNMRCEWPPFELDETDYLRLRQAIELHPEWGGEIDDSCAKLSSGEWFHWAFVRSFSKTPR